MTIVQLFKKPITWVILVFALIIISGLIFSIFMTGDDDKSTVVSETPVTNKVNDEAPDKDDDDEPTDVGENPPDDNPIDVIRPDPVAFGEVIDDWSYKPNQGSNPYSVRASPSSVAVESLSVADSSNIGLAVGGANGIENFRQNIKANYLPSPTDISHEGLFYDYFFDTGQTQACQELFCPSYTTAVSEDPLSGKTEYFISVGLNSGIDEADFKRKSLNLVVVLDVSGSMSAGLDDYYYDQLTDQILPIDRNAPSFERHSILPVTKMEVANRSLIALIDQLQPTDRLGIVLFDNQAYNAKSLRYIGETKLESLKEHILQITPQGGTNMEAGYKAGVKLFDEFLDVDAEVYENRIIFLTDAQPNTGALTTADLADLTEQAAEDSIYSSFIGVGVDFNTELVQAITQVAGANYYAVHSSEDFQRRLDEGFEYMVTPLVFDLNLSLDATGFEIKAVYGSPEADLATGEILKVNTLFPSLRIDGQTKGGLILLHLNKLSNDPQLKLTVSYKDRSGDKTQSAQTVEFSKLNDTYFDNTGIQKGVVLARFTNVMQGWLEHQATPQNKRPNLDYAQVGFPVIIEPINLSYWERTSRPLALSDTYRPVMTALRDYLVQETAIIGDQDLLQEVDLIDLILASEDFLER